MPADLLVRTQKTPLRGTITVPPDKSISHRVLMLGAIADGRSHIRNWLPAGDTLATLAAVRALGVAVTVTRQTPQSWDLIVEGRGHHGLQQPAAPLDCRNAGTCLRLLAGLLAGQAFPSVLDGSRQLRLRPMRRILAPLQQMGATITGEDDRAPLAITPSALQAIDYLLPVASAQVKSAVLLAGLYAAGQTRVRQPGPARDHTERLLAAMGADIVVNGDDVTVTPPADGRSLAPLDITVPGDISSAAFPLIAALIIPHSEVTINGVGVNETRTGLLDTLQAMGGAISIADRRDSGGEPQADLTARFDELHATAVAGDDVVRAIDEFPVWAIAATQAAGASSVRGAGELRVKEVDRIGVLAEQLRRMGTAVDEYEDGFTVDGPVHLYGAEVDSHGDHRLGMALAVAALRAHGPTLIHDADCIADSFPGFVETMQALGAEMAWGDG